MPAEAEQEPGGTAYYVYGVLDARAAARTDGVRGLGGARVEMVAGAGLGAIVSRVPLSEFDEEPLRERLEDLGWVEVRVREHERVLEAALPAGVLPLRFGAIFRSADHVRAMLAEHAAEFRDALTRIRGRTEWNVRAAIDERTLAGHTGAADESEPAPVETSAGRAYLERKQRERAVAAESDVVASRLGEATHERLRGAATAAALGPLRQDTPDLRPILNAAYLVDTRAEERFRATAAAVARELAPDGIAVEVTGPWPAYSFTELER